MSETCAHCGKPAHLHHAPQHNGHRSCIGRFDGEYFTPAASPPQGAPVEEPAWPRVRVTYDEATGVKIEDVDEPTAKCWHCDKLRSGHNLVLGQWCCYRVAAGENGEHLTYTPPAAPSPTESAADQIGETPLESATAEIDELRAALTSERSRAETAERNVGLLREINAAAESRVRELTGEVARLTTCSCGRTLSTGQCGICDNDD